jgi:hypothetical protein
MFNTPAAGIGGMLGAAPAAAMKHGTGLFPNAAGVGWGNPANGLAQAGLSSQPLWGSYEPVTSAGLQQTAANPWQSQQQRNR